MSVYSRIGKRVFDLSTAAVTVVLLSPIMLVTAIVIYLEDGGSPFFVSERVGRGGKPFKFYKFRSMPMNSANVPSASAGQLTITRTGRWLRRSNIDELPQLINILKGDMSIVGPRPGIASQTALMELRRSNGSILCSPGLTGLAQINSYDEMPETEKARFDGDYARDISFGLDMRIILRTFVYLTKPPPAY